MAGINERGNTSWYCRYCGKVEKALLKPKTPCAFCGNIFQGDGWGASGDANEVGGYNKSGLIITNVDKPMRS